MKALLIISIPLLMASAFCSSNTKKEALPCKPVPSSFAIVELFTSEGCSSCPAADETVAKLAKEFAGKVYVLGFHVDYWDHLGWKDTYSNSQYSDRQKEYASVFKLDGVYTPQVVVNGSRELIGSKESELRNVVSGVLNTAAPTTITLHAKTNEKNEVVVSYQTNNQQKNTVLNFALVKSTGATDVKNGENSGRRLSHINIVRDFKTVELTTNNGDLTLATPAGFTTKEYKVIAYLQDKSNFHITAATEISL